MGPYGGPAVVLFTHAHRDHFDSAAVERYRRSNPAAVVIGPPAQGAVPGQAADLGWVKVRPLPIPHGPTRRAVGHAAWLVTLDGTTALHLGDTQSEPATWRAAGVPEAGVDLALVPYWYALEEGRLEAAMALLKAGRVVLFHTSLDAADRGWTETSRRLRERFPQVRTPVKPERVSGLSGAQTVPQLAQWPLEMARDPRFTNPMTSMTAPTSRRR